MEFFLTDSLTNGNVLSKGNISVFCVHILVPPFGLENKWNFLSQFFFFSFLHFFLLRRQQKKPVAGKLGKGKRRNICSSVDIGLIGTDRETSGIIKELWKIFCILGKSSLGRISGQN